MSKFLTALPVNVKDLIDALPKNSFVHGITFDPTTQEVQVLWENERFETGLTVPTPFPQSQLSSKKLPKGVIDARKPRPAVQTPPVEQNAPTAIPEPAKPTPVYLTEDQYKEAIAKGQEMEFMGVEAAWKPVDPKNHTFTAGFYYRVVDKTKQEV